MNYSLIRLPLATGHPTCTPSMARPHGTGAVAAVLPSRSSSGSAAQLASPATSVEP